MFTLKLIKLTLWITSFLALHLYPDIPHFLQQKLKNSFSQRKKEMIPPKIENSNFSPHEVQQIQDFLELHQSTQQNPYAKLQMHRYLKSFPYQDHFQKLNLILDKLPNFRGKAFHATSHYPLFKWRRIQKGDRLSLAHHFLAYKNQENALQNGHYLFILQKSVGGKELEDLSPYSDGPTIVFKPHLKIEILEDPYREMIKNKKQKLQEVVMIQAKIVN